MVRLFIFRQIEFVNVVNTLFKRCSVSKSFTIVETSEKVIESCSEDNC